MAKDKDNFLMKKDWGYQFFDEEYPIDDATAGRMLKLMYAKILGIDYDPDIERSEKRTVNEWLRVINDNEEAYRKKCKRNSENVSNRWQSNENDTTVYDRIQNDTNDTTVYESNETVRIDTDTDTDTVTDTDTGTVTDTVTVSDSVTGTGSESVTETESDIPPYIPPSGRVAEVIADLNEVCGTHYRNCKANASLINARFKDGFTLDDFKCVHRKKAAEWKGTEREQFLRPETLYAPKHFESYLNQPDSRVFKSRDKPKFDANEYLKNIAMGGA